MQERSGVLLRLHSVWVDGHSVLRQRLKAEYNVGLFGGLYNLMSYGTRTM